ncbi:MAG: tetratricopeptide repeat protein [Acidobacteriota bacterium]
MASRASRRKKAGRKKPPVKAPATGGDKRTEKTPETRGRVWAFRLAALILVPLFLLSLLEAGLRIAGYGYPTEFYLGPDREGLYVTNSKFGWRFFTKELSREPIPGAIGEKKEGRIRIFILGGSAAYGVPGPGFSFGRVLEVMLRDRYPGNSFEVVNTAVTAVNSHVVREIAEECAGHEADLFVVYMGNNEVVGPYGPATVFQRWTPNLSVIRANLWVKSMRTGQMMEKLTGVLGTSGEKPGKWGGMEMFLDNPIAADDRRLDSVYDNFRRNLESICRIGRGAGTPIILSTVAVNLKDCPPFSSQHGAGISVGELEEWESYFNSGVEKEEAGMWVQALEEYESAARIDDRFAELRYRMGHCLMKEEKYEEARGHYIAARDLDVLRFRADTQINRIIREVGVEYAGEGAHIVDAERILGTEDASRGGIPGEELFFEHVHFEFAGNYLLARAVFDGVERALPQLAAGGGQTPPLSLQESAKALALTPKDELERLQSMEPLMSRPPFTNQLGHEARMAGLKERIRELERISSTREGFLDAEKTYEEALKQAPDDCTLRRAFGELLLDENEYESAAGQFGAVREKCPWLPAVYTDLGFAEEKMGRDNEAIAYFKKALELGYEPANNHANLGIVLGNQGKRDEAMAQYRKALEINPAHESARLNLAVTLTITEKFDEAVSHFEEILESNPDNYQAHYGLGYALSLQGRIEESVSHYRKSLEIEPGFEPAQNKLGNWLLEQGEADEAEALFRRAVESNPNNAKAWLGLAVVLTSKGNSREAVPYFEKSLKTEPEDATAHYYFGKALADLARFSEAISHYQKAIEMDSTNYLAYYQLGIILTSLGRTEEAIGNFRQALKINPLFTAAQQEIQSLQSEGKLE